jgi:mono/diheme cytochrome c family protein
VNSLRYSYLAAVMSMIVLSGCSSPPGQRRETSEILAPNEVTDSRTLYAENCAGCHGSEGRGGAAIALADPVYFAIANDASIRKVVANGVKGTSMPAFAQSAGGMLTNKQIDLITTEMRSRWSRPEILNGANPPAYAANSAGNARQGEVVYGTYCASCHGSQGQGARKGSAITNDSFLALVSDQGLRTIIITGRPELGAPDWRGNLPGKAMSNQEITDVVAWMASRRVQIPGQPYGASNYAQRQESDNVH